MYHLDDADTEFLHLILLHNNPRSGIKMAIGISGLAQRGDRRSTVKQSAENHSGLDLRKLVNPMMVEGQTGFFINLRRCDPRLDPESMPTRGLSASLVRPKWTMLRPAVIQFTSPERISCTEPRLS